MLPLLNITHLLMVGVACTELMFSANYVDICIALFQLVKFSKSETDDKYMMYRLYNVRKKFTYKFWSENACSDVT